MSISDPEFHVSQAVPQVVPAEAGVLEKTRLAGRCMTNNLGYLAFAAAVVGVTALATVLALSNMQRTHTDWSSHEIFGIVEDEFICWTVLGVAMTIAGAVSAGFAVAIHLKRRKMEEQLEELKQKPETVPGAKEKLIASQEALIAKLRILDHVVAAVALICLTVAVVTWIAWGSNQGHTETKKTWIPERNMPHGSHTHYTKGYWKVEDQRFFSFDKSLLERIKIITAVGGTLGAIGVVGFYGLNGLMGLCGRRPQVEGDQK